MGEPARCSSSAIRLAFQMLQAYRMPRHRLTPVPATATTQARAGTARWLVMPRYSPLAIAAASWPARASRSGNAVLLGAVQITRLVPILADASQDKVLAGEQIG